MIKKFLLGLVLLAALCSLFFINQRNYDSKIKQSDIFNRIPKSALFIIESEDLLNTSRELLQSNLIIQNLKDFDTFKAVQPLQDLSNRLDSLYPSISQNPIQGAFSAHPIGQQFELVCHLYIPSFDISYLIPDTLKPKKLEYDEKTYYKSSNIFYHFSNDVLSLSTNEALIREILRAESTPESNILSDSIFTDLRKTVGKVEKGHLFVFHETIDKYFNSTPNKWVLAKYFPKNYAYISAFDIRYEPNLISLAGISYAKAKNTLSLSKDQSSVTLPSDYIPEKAIGFRSQSFADGQLFLENFLKQNNTINLSSNEQENWAKLAYRHFGTFTLNDDELRFLRLQNQQSWTQAFSDKMTTTGEVVSGTTIYKIHPSLVLSNSTTTLYGAIVHNTLYTCTSLSTLEDCIIQISYDHQQNTFKQFTAWYKYLSGEGTGLFGINTKKLNAHSAEKEQRLYNNLSYILAESSHLKNQKYYQYIILGYDPKAPTTPHTVWENNIELDSVTIQLVRNHYSNNLEVLAYDPKGNMKLLSSSGKTLWQRNLQEPIYGKVSQVDLFKNNKLQMAFATPTGIFLVDRLGRTVEHFPIYLKTQSKSGLCVADYDNNKDYRALISSTDGEVHNYDLAQSTATKGWAYRTPKTSKELYSNAALFTPKVLRIKGKDYIIQVLKDGQVQVLSRRGDIRFEANITINTSSPNYYILKGSDIKSTALVYAQENKLVYHYLSGKQNTVLVHTRNPIEQVLPLKGGKEQMFIVRSGDEVAVYSGIELRKALTGSYALIEKSKNYITLKNSEGKLATLDNGLNLVLRPISYGETLLIGSIQNNRTENVLSYDKSKVYCYKLENR